MRGQAFARESVQDARAIQAGKAEVDDRHVGCELADLCKRRGTVSGLADQLEVRARPDGARDPVAVDGMVFGYVHAHTSRHAEPCQYGRTRNGMKGIR